MTTTATQVAAAKSLIELRDALNAFEVTDDRRLEDVVDLPGLPTFGGEDPRRTDGVWSWDADSVLLYDNGRGYYIEQRDPDAWYA